MSSKFAAASHCQRYNNLQKNEEPGSVIVAPVMHSTEEGRNLQAGAGHISMNKNSKHFFSPCMSIL